MTLVNICRFYRHRILSIWVAWIENFQVSTLLSFSMLFFLSGTRVCVCVCCAPTFTKTIAHSSIWLWCEPFYPDLNIGCYLTKLIKYIRKLFCSQIKLVRLQFSSSNDLRPCDGFYFVIGFGGLARRRLCAIVVKLCRYRSFDHTKRPLKWNPTLVMHWIVAAAADDDDGNGTRERDRDQHTNGARFCVVFISFYVIVF